MDAAHDGLRGLELACAGSYDLVVLDLRLPGLDGGSVLHGIVQAKPDLPVVVLSGVADVRAKVRCLELGASDFVAKPFDLAEFLLRVRARLHEPPPGPVQRVLRAGSVSLDLRRMTADAGGGAARLSPREFRLLQYLMLRRGQVCTRSELLEEVWDYSFDPGTNIVDVYVGRVRAKLGDEVIETVRNVGYSLAV